MVLMNLYLQGRNRNTDIENELVNMGGLRRGVEWINIYKALYSTVGEGNGTPLQYSCLENPMDGGAW